MRLAIIAIFILIATIVAAFKVSAAPRPVDQKTFNALMNQLYPSGKGPSSTSSARGFYRGGNGNWKRR